MLVAINATESLEIPGGGMTFVTLVPFPFVVSTENGEIRLVVLGKIGRHPTRVGRMTGRTIGREIIRLVIRTGRGFVVILMASKTIGGCVGKIISCMALGTIVDLMAPGQGEKQVVRTAG